MCGFAGDAGATTRLRDAPETLTAMGTMMAARGPDGTGSFADDLCRITFRRLAVNDLVGGDQPFRSADGSITVVVNGEIYNHAELAGTYLPGERFATRSDCEIVLHLYKKLGAAVFPLLHGMFAIAIWDARRRSLVLCRDRLGIKPLYWSRIPSGVAFASELRALLVHPEVPRALDWSALRDIPDIAFPYHRPAGRRIRSGLSGVEQISPGSTLVWRPDRAIEISRYWDPVGPSPDAVLDERFWIDRYADLLDDSVRMRLMSEVPVGVFLSGGVDSALVAALAVRHGASLEAFTLVEDAISAGGDPAAAQQVSAALGLPLHAVRVDAAALDATLGLGLETIEHLVWIMDFPVVDPEILFKHELHRFVAATRPDTKVILLGQGADEFAGGYSRAGPASWSRWIAREDDSARRARAVELGLASSLADLVSDRVADEIAVDLPDVARWQAMRFGDLAAHNLWHEDRTAAASGRESRVPFLDHRLVELCCSVPIALHERLFEDKRIERAVAERVLPTQLAQLAHRPKIGIYDPRSGSIASLRRRLTIDAFPAYRDAYLAADDSLFDEARLVHLHERALAGGDESATALLLRCIAISVFDRLVRTIGTSGFIPPTPLRSETPLPADLGAAGESDPPSPVSALRTDVSFAVARAPRPTLLVLTGDRVLARIEIGPQSSTDALDLLLGAGGADAATLAAAIGVAPEQLQPILDVLGDPDFASADR